MHGIYQFSGKNKNKYLANLVLVAKWASSPLIKTKNSNKFFLITLWNRTIYIYTYEI